MGKWSDRVTKNPDLVSPIVAYVQFRDGSGNWIKVSSVLQSNPLAAQTVMAQVKSMFPDRTVRTVDSKGRIIDFL